MVTLRFPHLPVVFLHPITSLALGTVVQRGRTDTKTVRAATEKQLPAMTSYVTAFDFQFSERRRAAVFTRIGRRGVSRASCSTQTIGRLNDRCVHYGSDVVGSGGRRWNPVRNRTHGIRGPAVVVVVGRRFTRRRERGHDICHYPDVTAASCVMVMAVAALVLGGTAVAPCRRTARRTSHGRDVRSFPAVLLRPWGRGSRRMFGVHRDDNRPPVVVVVIARLHRRLTTLRGLGGFARLDGGALYRRRLLCAGSARLGRRLRRRGSKRAYPLYPLFRRGRTVGLRGTAVGCGRIAVVGIGGCGGGDGTRCGPRSARNAALGRRLRRDGAGRAAERAYPLYPFFRSARL